MKKQSVIAGAGLFFAAVLVGSASAANESYVAVHQDGSWTVTEYSDSLENSYLRTHKGGRADGGCIFSGERTINGDVTTVSVEREVATNYDTCVMITEIGEQDADGDGLESSGGSTSIEWAKPSVNGG